MAITFISYIQNTQCTFDLFAKCLSKEGILYTGVNGATHFGIKIRKSFEYLGHNPNKFEDTLETRRLIELFDRLLPDQSHLAGNGTPAYISSDVLNTFSLNLTLPEWIKYAEHSGVHFVSSAELIPSLSKTLSPNIFPLLVPKSRKELCKLVEINDSASFHRLIFSKSAPLPIPWHDMDALLDCEFQTTWLYAVQNPISNIYGELFLSASVASENDTNLRWSIDDVALKLLQQKEESRCIRDALGDSLEAYKDNPNAWPPDEQMDRWIFAVSGRRPEWHLCDPEQVVNTITQHFGVGSSSLDESEIATNEAEEEAEEDEDAAVIRFVQELRHKPQDRAQVFATL